MLAVGFCHQAAVADDGAIYTWGYGGCVRLGHGDLGERRTPTRLGKEWFAGRQSDFALQAVVECRALEPECVLMCCDEKGSFIQ
jgi:hypothetical protein